MHNKRPWLPAVLASAALFAAAAASAAGFAASSTGAMLGQPLDFTVQLRLDAGEPLAPECVSAEVTVGERKLAAAAVRTAVEMAGAELARVHVRTSLAVDEPVVGVLLNVGCTSRVSRRFVVLADPPMFAASPAAVPVVAVLPGEATPTSVPPAPVAAEARQTEAAAAAPAPAARSSVARAEGLSAKRAERRAERRAAEARGGPRVAQARRVRAPVAPVAEAAPRLKLEAAEAAPMAPVAAVEEALLAVAQAASAARAAASAASAASDRIAGLERTVEDLRGEAKVSRELAAQLRDRLARSEEASRWTLPLLALVLCLTGLAAWMAWRLNSAQRVRQQGWQAAVPAREPLPPPVSTFSGGTPSRQPTSPIPFVTSEIKPPESPRPRGTPAWPPAAPTVDLDDATQPMQREPSPPYPYDNAMTRTEVLPARAVEEAPTPARDVSIEELIDLEQQAEFFVVLGQDDAAVDLLLEHLRHTGGSSPLPYLKLLEIYRRRGDRAEYERTRTRFNQRFNAYAPEWDADLQAGRSLESYPGVLPRLQQVWARPLDAMAELEALLFRKSRGDLFELPAYRDVLLLYALARDLLDRESADSGNVDLLLPMADGSEFSSTSPAPFMGLERDSGFGNEASEDRPTVPVDLDLTSGHDRPTSLFDTLDTLPEPASRRR
jgi:hypothetical protein